MSLPALDDIAAHTGTADPIDGVMRIETSPREKATPVIMEMMRSVYPHDEVFGRVLHGQRLHRLPARRTLRVPCRHPLAWRSGPTACAGSRPPTSRGCGWPTTDWVRRPTIYTRTVANPQARTVDYHCAWDQGKHLWMIYLMRVIDAQVVLDKPGSVVLWTNCHHPFYDDNPYPESAPPERPVWVGDFWDMFGAGHELEMKNLKAIAEYRHRNGLPVTPEWMK